MKIRNEGNDFPFVLNLNKMNRQQAFNHQNSRVSSGNEQSPLKIYFKEFPFSNWSKVTKCMHSIQKKVNHIIFTYQAMANYLQ